MPPGGLDDGHRFGVVQRERFLAEDVLAGFGGLDRPFRVHRMRRRDVDRLDLRVGEQFLVAAVAARDAELRAERLGGFLRAAADGDQPPRFGLRHRLGEGARDGAGSQNAPSQAILH